MEQTISKVFRVSLDIKRSKGTEIHCRTAKDEGPVSFLQKSILCGLRRRFLCADCLANAFLIRVVPNVDFLSGVLFRRNAEFLIFPAPLPRVCVITGANTLLVLALIFTTPSIVLVFAFLRFVLISRHFFTSLVVYIYYTTQRVISQIIAATPTALKRWALSGFAVKPLPLGMGI